MILMMSAQLSTLGLLKIRVFWNEGSDMIISAYDFYQQNLLLDSNYIVDVVHYQNLKTLAFLWEKLS